MLVGSGSLASSFRATAFSGSISSPPLVRDHLREAFDRFADRLAVVTDYSRFTYRELGDRIRRLSSLFDSFGVGPGDYLAIVMSPRADFFCDVWLAKAEHGATL